MTSFERFETRLPALLDELSTPRLPDYADDLFARTAATRQRPGWTFLERWFPMSAITGRFAFAPRVPWRLGVVLALLLLAGLIALYVVGSRNARLAPPFGPAANGLIAYASAGDIFVGDTATGTTKLLIGGSDVDSFPLFSPDGSHVAFVRNAPGADTASRFPIELYVARADGTDLRRLATGPLIEADVPWVGWTPDSRQFWVIHAVDGVNQLDLVDASSGGSTRRLEAAAGLTQLQYRPPDGREVLFRACVDHPATGPTNCGLYVMNADGSNRRQLAKPNAPLSEGDTLDLNAAAYSADGSRIFMNRWTDDASMGDPGCCHLYVMNADGTNEHEFVPNDGSGVWDGLPQVSPDGRYVAFLHNSNHGLGVIRADGTGPIIDTGPPMPQGAHWVWAPDSSKILVWVETGAESKAFLVDPEGAAFTQVPWLSNTDIDWQRLAP